MKEIIKDITIEREQATTLFYGSCKISIVTTRPALPLRGNKENRKEPP
jgi:hypothetical protein